MRAFRDEVIAAIGTASLVDIRSPEEYAGRMLAPAHWTEYGSLVGVPVVRGDERGSVRA